jgi:hypothetical protein
VDAWEKWDEEEVAISPIHYFSWIFDVFLIVAFIGRYRTLLILNSGPISSFLTLKDPGFWEVYFLEK